MKLRVKIVLIYCFSILLSIPLFSQQVLDEMQLIDISNEPDIRSSIMREPEQALLIVKTQISELRVQSNNIIIKSEEKEKGTWHIVLAPGTHRISFQAKGFISVQQRFYFNPKDVKGVQIRVIPAAEKKEEKNTGYIVIQSEPDSAKVFFNSQFYGETPYLGKIISGSYELEIRKEPFPSYEDDIVIIAGQTLPINVKFSSLLGKITVASEPEGAKVYINDRFLGKAPIEYAKLFAGMHQLKVILENYHDYEKEFEISTKKKLHEFTIPLTAKKSELNLNGSPKNSTVKIDNIEIGKLPLQNKSINFGIHSLSIEKPGFHKHEKLFVVDSEQAYDITVNLKPQSRYMSLLYSTFVPGSGQLYSGQTTKGWILGLVTLSGVAASVLINNDYLNKRQNYFDSKESYEKNLNLSKMVELYDTMQNNHAKMEDSYNTAVIAAGVTAGMWLYNMIDTILFFPDQKQKIVTVSINNKHPGLSMNLVF
jgi:TM2 domain-containing membrane protein YozV